VIRDACFVRATNGTRSTLHGFFNFFFISRAIFAKPRVEFVHGLDGEDHADGAAQSQTGFPIADVNRATVEGVEQSHRAEAAEESFVLHHAEVAFLACDGAIFLADFANGDNRVLREAEAFDAFFIEFAEDEDHQGLIEFVAGTAITIIRDGLKDAMIFIVEEIESNKFERGLARGSVAMDEIFRVTKIVLQ
jgi:hypothetical protein